MIAAGMLLACALSVRAQQVMEVMGPGPVVAISENLDGRQEMVNVFAITQSAYFHDPQAPRFILIDQQSRWALGIGGYVQAKMEYDFDGIVDNVDFFPSQIPCTGNPASSQTQFSATSSTVFLKLVGKAKGLGNFVVYTAGNWKGSDNNLHLRNAYISFLGFTAGYDMGLFTDMAACPPTIDYAGPSGMTIYRTTVFRWEHNLGKSGLSMGVGLEMPGVNATDSRTQTVGPQRFPNVPLYLQYSWNNQSHFRLNGIFRDITYSNLSEGKNDREEAGWGAQASLVTTLGPKLSIFGQYTVGEGIAGLLNDMSNLPVDIVAHPNEPGKMMLLLTDGWYAGMRYNFCKNAFATATYSQTSLHSKQGYGDANPTQYKRGQYVVANLFTNVTPNLQLGLEYLHGWRTNFDDDTYNANRINLSARYNF